MPKEETVGGGVGVGASCDFLFLTCVWDAVVKPEMSPAKCPYGV